MVTFGCRVEVRGYSLAISVGYRWGLRVHLDLLRSVAGVVVGEVDM